MQDSRSSSPPPPPYIYATPGVSRSWKAGVVCSGSCFRLTSIIRERINCLNLDALSLSEMWVLVKQSILRLCRARREEERGETQNVPVYVRVLCRNEAYSENRRSVAPKYRRGANVLRRRSLPEDWRERSERCCCWLDPPPPSPVGLSLHRAGAFFPERRDPSLPPFFPSRAPGWKTPRKNGGKQAILPLLLRRWEGIEGVRRGREGPAQQQRRGGAQKVGLAPPSGGRESESDSNNPDRVGSEA